jgi:amphi-Trp domain-containing protein
MSDELIEVEESVTLSREAAADRLRAIADQLSRHNELAWVQEGLKTSVKVPDEVELKVEIEVKEGGGGELEVEIHW